LQLSCFPMEHASANGMLMISNGGYHVHGEDKRSMI
jgi:hypothetical protein